MPDFIRPSSAPDQTPGPRRRPLYGSFYIALAVPAAFIIWFLRRLAATIIGLFRVPPPAREDGAGQIRRIRVPGLLDPNQVAAVTAVIRGSMTIIPVGPRQSDSSDSDWSGSTSSDDDDDDDQRNHPIHQHLLYSLIHELEAGDARLFVPGSTEQLRELVRGLPVEPDAELRWRGFMDARGEDGFYRLCDILENPWILKAGTEAFPGPCALTDESMMIWLMKLKITTKLVGLSKRELHEQSWESCEELKEECFAEVAGQCLEQLLEVACSFSDARWSDGHISQQLTVFDALVDVLFNIRDFSFSRSHEVPGIVNKMVNALKGAIQGTSNDIHSSKESTIHPATIALIRVLDFFCRNRNMVQVILDSDHCSEMFNCWVSKLKEGAQIIFQEKGQRYIFILNNTRYVLQMKCHPGLLLPNVVSNLDSLIEQYIMSYLDEYWFPPMLSYLDGDSLNKPRRSSLDKFTEEFFMICDGQMTWKVQTQLKKILREEIIKLIVPKYVNFLAAVQANPSSRWSSRFKRMWHTRPEKPEYTGVQLTLKIKEIFER